MFSSIPFPNILNYSAGSEMALQTNTKLSLSSVQISPYSPYHNKYDITEAHSLSKQNSDGKENDIEFITQQSNECTTHQQVSMVLWNTKDGGWFVKKENCSTYIMHSFRHTENSPDY